LCSSDDFPEPYYRARYYDIVDGRFINEDPAQFDGGLNFYSYVENDPADYVDPFGLQKYRCNFLGACYKAPHHKPELPSYTPAPDGLVFTIANLFPGTQVRGSTGARVLVIPLPCPLVSATLLAQGYETGVFPPFNNPKDHAGGYEFRTRSPRFGFHLRMKHPYELYQTHNYAFRPCAETNCTLDQFHMDPNNPLGGDVVKHFKDFLNQ
jgi:hypothetical protein